MLFLVLGAGCRGPGNESDAVVEEIGTLPAEVTAATGEGGPGGDGEVAATPLPDLTGKVYLVYELAATAPTEVVNPAWEQAIQACTLTLLFRAIEHDSATRRALFEVASGWSDCPLTGEGQPALAAFGFSMAPAILELHLDGPRFTIPDPFTLDLFPAFVSKPFHIERLRGSGLFSADGAYIEELRLDGCLGETEVTDFCLLIPGLGTVNFHWFMNLAGICPDADADGDGVNDSYNFRGVARAQERSELFSEEVREALSLVPDCPVDNQPCKE